MCKPGGYRLPILQAHAKDLRKCLTKLIELATPDTTGTTPVTEVDSYRRGNKARMVLYPQGNLADWCSFCKRFQDYVGKLHQITGDERLSYL